MRLFCVFVLFILVSMGVRAQETPNIIIFLVDDMGWQDTSVPFWSEETPLNGRYHTPNMERLAAEGMKFTSAYSAPVCTPTRVSLMTGMNVIRHHITNWTNINKNTPTDKEDDVFERPDWNYNGFSPEEGVPHTAHATALPQILKEHGYFTIHVGKGHWGSMGTPGSNPYNLGFIVNVGGTAIGQPQSYQGEDNYGNMPGKTSFHAVQGLNEYYGSEMHLSEALTREAIKALDAPLRNRQPFFLNMAHYAVHTPIQADMRFYKKYHEDGLDETEAKYASMVEGMDKSLGDIMDFLRARDAEKNTIVMFMSDNGGLSITPLRGGEEHTHNLPLRAGKGSVYEGGIRVPMIVKWPGVVKAGSTSDQYVIVEDYFPTVLEMAGVRHYRKVQTIDGRSFVPILKDPAHRDQERPLIWHAPNKWRPEDGPGINYKSAIRQGDWKLIYHMRSGKTELFNVTKDIGETKDLAGQHPAKAKALSELLSSRLRESNAPMPVRKETGKRLPYSDEL